MSGKFLALISVVVCVMVWITCDVSELVVQILAMWCGMFLAASLICCEIEQIGKD